MSRGMTIAEFVQSVYYAIYKVRLDVNQDVAGAFHSNTDKFKEVVMEANFVLQELQKEQDWNWLRDKLELGHVHHHHGIGRFDLKASWHNCPPMEFELPEWVYKPCTGYNDAVRLVDPHSMRVRMTIPWIPARSGSAERIAAYDSWGRHNVRDDRIQALQVGDTVTFTRPFYPHEVGVLETDVIRLLEPLHICDDSCPDNCPKAYKDKVFTEVSDPQYMVLRTARARAEGDPSAMDRVQGLTDEHTKMLSAMRENDSGHTTTDYYTTAELGYMSVY